jgi:molybdenum cofactor cytidylyltransferase
MTAIHGAIILAAGASARLGRAKQLVDIDGEPMLRRAARCVLATAPHECIVVLGHEADRIEAALDGVRVRTLRIIDADTGMAASLAAGVDALDKRCEGALVVLTDQPALSAGHLQRLVDAWRAAPARAAASAYAGVLGVPALLPRAWFGDVGALRGNVGARALLRGRADEVVAIDAPELARDIDVPEDLARIRALNR